MGQPERPGGAPALPPGAEPRPGARRRQPGQHRSLADDRRLCGCACRQVGTGCTVVVCPSGDVQLKQQQQQLPAGNCSSVGKNDTTCCSCTVIAGAIVRTRCVCTVAAMSCEVARLQMTHCQRLLWEQPAHAPTGVRADFSPRGKLVNISLICNVLRTCDQPFAVIQRNGCPVKTWSSQLYGCMSRRLSAGDSDGNSRGSGGRKQEGRKRHGGPEPSGRGSKAARGGSGDGGPLASQLEYSQRVSPMLHPVPAELDHWH